jgi:arsenical pump membrane protein
VRRAVLVTIDCAPNLSVTGSLATVLWLEVLRRDGLVVSAREFWRLGLVVGLPAVALASLALSLSP